MRTKKAVVILMMLVLTISALACGEKKAMPETGKTDGETTKEAGNDITLTYQTNSASDMITMVFDEYTKEHPNIHLDVQVVDNSQMDTKIASQFNTNTLPDFAWMNGNMWRNGFLQTDSVLDVTEIIKNDIGESKFVQDTFMQLVTGDGSYVAFPAEMQIQGFLVNPSLFEKYDLEIPKNFAELKHCAEVFQENGVVLFGSGTKDDWPTWPWYTWLRLWGIEEQGDALFQDHTLNWADSDVIQAYYRLAELKEAGAFPENNATITYEQSKTMFLAEQCAALPTSTDQLAGIVNSDLDNMGKIQYWFGIGFEDSSYNQDIAVKVVNNGFGVSANISEEKLAVLIDFFKYFYSTEGANILIKEGIVLPITEDVTTEVSPLVESVIDLVQDPSKKAVMGASYVWFGYHEMQIEYFIDFHMAHEQLMNGTIDGSIKSEEIPERAKKMDELIASGIENYERVGAE